MSNRSVPPFDLLTGQEAPYTGFGMLLPESSERLRRLRQAATEAKRRIEDGFEAKLVNSPSVPEQLDRIIGQMWSDGWSPDEGDLNLFATDFGLVLIEELLSRFEGNVVFRSEEDMTHTSVWWPKHGVEAFPFHHVAKCLLTRGTDSIGSIVKGVAGRVQPNCV